MRFEFVGEARVVFWRSSSSLLGIAATAFGAIAAMQGHLPLLQPMVSPKVFAGLTLFADACPQIAVALTAAIPFARIMKQDRLRELTGHANPQPDEVPHDQ